MREGARRFEASRAISRPPPDGFESAGFPALDLDGDGNVYVLWELFPRPGRFPRGLGFTHSRDGGRSFAPPTLVPGSAEAALGVNGSQQGLLMRKLAVNDAGEIAVVNSSFKQNRESHIWLYRGQAAEQ